MSKKLPSNTNENGIVGKPAEPTVEPGGRPAAADCVAATPVAGAGAVVDDDEEVEELGGGVLELGGGVLEPAGVVVVPFADETAAACAAIGAAAGADAPDAVSLIERKSMCVPVDMWASW